MTNSKKGERARLSLRREGISGRTVITMIDVVGILLGSPSLRPLKW